MFSAYNIEWHCESLNDDTMDFLPVNCDEPIHFRIDRQEPCSILEVNPYTGELSRHDGKVNDLYENYDGGKSSISYSVTNSDVVTQGNFIILDIEEE